MLFDLIKRRRGLAAFAVLGAVAGGVAAVGPAAAAPQPGVDAGALTWGDGGLGALGDGAIDTRPSPALYAGPNIDFTELSAQGQHMMARAADGTLWAWGDNTRRQVGVAASGIDFPPAVETPVQVPFISGVRTVAAGGVFSLAVTDDGQLYEWGEDLVAGNNQGGPDAFDIPIPQPVAGFTNTTRISADATHALILDGTGTVYGWGDNVTGQLGDGNTDRRDHPTKIDGLPAVREIATGLRHSLALGVDGLVYGWGDNTRGELGQGSGGQNQYTTPQVVLGLSTTNPVVQLSAGSDDSVARLADGTVVAWGANDQGQLGDGTQVDRNLPVQVQGVRNAGAIASGSTTNIAVSGGHVFAWGDNRAHQLGDGTTTSRPVAAQVPGLDGVVAAGMALFAGVAAVHQQSAFGVSLNPTSARVVVGTSTSTTVSFTAGRGLTGSRATLSVGTLPPGVTAAFGDTAPDVGTTTTLSFSVSRNGPAGTFHIPVTATAPGGLTATATFDLTVARTCTLTNATAVPIPDNGPPAVSRLDGAACGPVQFGTAVVEVHITHPHAGDLVISLVDPTGTVHPLKAADPKDASVDVNRTFLVQVGRRPGAPQAVPAAGSLWDLRVQDVAAGNTGTIVGWTLTI